MAFVAAALAAAEGLSRLLAPDYLARRPAVVLDALHRYSEVYGWELRPGARQRDGDRWTSVNARGHRGREVAPARTPGRTRVVLLGDSITFGTYVGDGETFAERLSAARPDLEVVNLAVQGYGLDQSLLKLEHEGLALSPDVVVLNVCLANDFADGMLASFLHDARHPKPYFRLEGGRLVLHDEHVRLGPMERVGRLLRERSHLYNRLSDAAGGGGSAADSQAPGEWASRRAQALGDEAAAQELALRLAARMRERSEGHGAAFVVLLHPDKRSFRRGSVWIDAFYASPELQGVTIVDMRREYRRERLGFPDLFLDGLGHLSPDGHRRAAAVIARVLDGVRVPEKQAARTKG